MSSTQRVFNGHVLFFMVQYGMWLNLLLIKNNFNSHAVGMAIAWPNGFEVNFVINTISGSAAWFSIIILKFNDLNP